VAWEASGTMKINPGIIDAVSAPTRADDPGRGKANELPSACRGEGAMAAARGSKAVGWYRPGKGVL
jgi:hypothetical protein